MKYNGKEITKEEFRILMSRRTKIRIEIKRLSKTELGREILKRKGIEPIE